ncbi:MAG: hydrogenase 4 subunit B [Verrucomicrobiota bacterium]
MEPLAGALLQLGLLSYLAGALGGFVFQRMERVAHAVSFACCLLAAMGLTAASLLTLTSGIPATGFDLCPSSLPFLRFNIRPDALGLFFVMIVSLLGVALSLFSMGYARGYFGRKNVGVLGAFFNLLMLATTLVFLAGNAFFFLLAWEVMALMSFCLVSYEHENAEARGAGILYFVMSHIGTGCLIIGFLLLFQAAGSYEFDGFHALGNQMPPGKRNGVFLLFLIGFGIKAGMVPMHIWLPAAHPVAPSNVSAMMSGVLIKTGIYGMTRVFFDFLGTPPVWWGVTVLSLGIISAVLGVLYALMEHDLKRLLAYHSIENIGIILMGLGASLMFLHFGHPALAALAMVAGLFHTLNHAMFKALLFLGAGAVLHATGTRDMEKMGGLIKKMPGTALYFLVGAVAISALPPLNGFISEWFTYQALLQGFGLTSSLVRLIFPLGGAMLALTGALAASCFVKAFAITFLAQPRSEPVAKAHEASPTMLAGMAILTMVCLVLGLFPAQCLVLFDPITQALTGAQLSQHLALADGWAIGNLDDKGGTVSTLGMVVAAVCLLPIPIVLWWLFARRAITRIGPTWDCGLQGLTPKMEYSATGFSKPLRMIFKALFRPHREVQREYDYSPYFARNLRFESHIEEAFERRIYRPLNRWVLVLSRRMRAMQAGSTHAYLIYIFVTMLLLLLIMAL